MKKTFEIAGTGTVTWEIHDPVIIEQIHNVEASTGKDIGGDFEIAIRKFFLGLGAMCLVPGLIPIMMDTLLSMIDNFSRHAMDEIEQRQRSKNPN